MEVSLDAKVALITGGSRGIGFEIANVFAQSGASVVLFSRKEESLKGACEEIRELAPQANVSYRIGNAGDSNLPFEVVESVVSEYGGIDILVNNAGTNPHYGSTLSITPEQMDKILSVNVKGVMRWTQAVWEHVWKDGSHKGSVVNIASIGGVSVGGGIGFYNVSKAAVIHLTKQLASEMGPMVRVNAISPGLVKTDMARALWESYGEQLAERLPARRLGETLDIAKAALFLASSMSEWVTGENLVVDGGSLLI